MPLEPGAAFGPYKIVGPLGAGGMGEVYRAQDTKLRREVAIKVLPASFARDPDRLLRFEREARLLAALNHPHIGAIYGLQEAGGVRGLVLELIEGPTLAERLAAGPVPLDEALTIARQLVIALDAAHEKGIIHRDLKPANVKITPERVVKVLDFGLAKAVAGEASGPDPSQSSTLAKGATREGVVVGTAGYMSPEQARGRPVDKRTDIWAFGCVLYELLTGRLAFGGDTVSDTIAAILSREPDWRALPATTPVSLRRLLERCLEKDPKQRLRDIGDAQAELNDGFSLPARRPGMTPELTRQPGRGWTWPVGAAAFLAGLVAWSVWQHKSEVSRQNPLARATFERLTDFDGSELDAAISPDGKFVVFLSDRDGPFDAFVTQVGSGAFINLTKGQVPQLLNEIVPNVGFSADGTQVWIRTGGIVSADNPATENIRLMPTMGGIARPFLDGVMAAWSPDGSSVAYHESSPGDPMYIADRNGSNPRRVFADQPGSHCHFLAWSPDARFLYFVRGVPLHDLDIWRIPSIGGEPEPVTHHDSRVAYPVLLDDRTLLYTATADDGTGPWLYWMDLERRVAARVNVSVEQYISISASAESAKPRRLVATVSNPSMNLWSVPIADRVVGESAASRFPLPTARSAGPRFGPDYLVYLASRGAANGLWKFRDGSVTELWKAEDGAVAGTASVSPDGRRICFPVRRQGRNTLHVATADGTNARPVAEALDVRGSASWSPDGKWIAVTARQGDGPRLFKVPTDGGPPVRLVDSPSSIPVWSPSGAYILYSGAQQGATVPVMAVTPEGRPYPLPELWVYRVGENYRFLPSGKQLVLMQGGFRRQNFWLLDLTTGRRRQLTDLHPGSSLRSFDVSPDGKSILFDRVREHSDIVLIELGRQ